MVEGCKYCESEKPFILPEEIIDAYIEGNLVLFCGAGISTESKAVLPNSFYSLISRELDLPDDSLSFSEVMQRYCDLPNGRRKLLKSIRDRFNYIDSFPELKRQATKFHRELCELNNIRTILTTNWDTYFEDCCKAIPIVMPEDYIFHENDSRFVIKIHGSIHNLSSIVATTSDYEKCLENLRNGIIGATLKAALARNTVVFIGFSFGDDDLSQIISYLQEEMGEVYPHIYVVTLDESLESKLNYKNSTFFITSGNFFLYTLKCELLKMNEIKNISALPFVYSMVEKAKSAHNTVTEINKHEHPCVIFALVYLDGVIHAFERASQNYSTGEYNVPGLTGSIAIQYKLKAKNSKDQGNYWDEIYYLGYFRGLSLLEMWEENIAMVDEFPFYYLPNASTKLISHEVFLQELTRSSMKNDEYYRFANEIISKYDYDVQLHHPPY